MLFAGLLAIEACKKQITPLRGEERVLNAKIKILELSVIEKARSKECQKLLDSAIIHFDTIEKGFDFAGKSIRCSYLWRERAF